MTTCQIIGHARSGTTILLSALNCSRRIYLLGEANNYLTGHLPDFRERFNAQHVTYGNQPYKLAYAPRMGALADTADGNAYMAALAARIGIAGEKIALGPEDVSGTDYGLLKAWLEFHHWDAHILLTLRHPRQTLDSNRKKFGTPEFKLLASMARSMAFAIDISRIFPNAAVMVHEAISAETFALLGERMGVDLMEGSAMYETQYFGRNVCATFEMESALQELSAIYQALVALVSPYTLTFSMCELQTDKTLPDIETRGPQTIGELYRALHGFADRMLATEVLVA